MEKKIIKIEIKPAKTLSFEKNGIFNSCIRGI